MLNLPGGVPPHCRVTLEEAWLRDPSTLWVNQRPATIDCMEEEPRPCSMPLEVPLGKPDNLSVSQRSTNYQKHHGLIARLSSNLHSEMPIVCSQSKGPRVLKVGWVLPGYGPGY